MEIKDRGNKKGGRKKLDNIISKLAEYQLKKANKNEDEILLDEVQEAINDGDMSKTEPISVEPRRKSKRKPEKTSKASHNQENCDQSENSLTIVKSAESDEDFREQDEIKHDDVLEEEKKINKKKRKKRGKDLLEDSDIPSTVNCSACNKLIQTRNGKLCRHPDLNTLICKKCYMFYSSGKFTKDEYGVEEYCRWCADGGELICCDFCEKAFCKDCIKRNLGKSKLKELLESGEDEQWSCFCCDPDPISNKILFCNKIMHFLDERKDQDIPYKDKKGRKIIHGPNQSERRSLLTNITGEQAVKSEDSLNTSLSKKTYSKRFQDGNSSRSKTEESSQNSGGESSESEDDASIVVSSEEDVKNKKKSGVKNKKKSGVKNSRFKNGVKTVEKSKSAKSKIIVENSDSDVSRRKAKKSLRKKNKSNQEKEPEDVSLDEMADSETKKRRTIGKTNSSRNKVSENDSDIDFVSMVKKPGKETKHGNKKKNNKRDMFSSEETSEDESDKESKEEESSAADNERKGKERQSRSKRRLISSSEIDGSTSGSEEDPIPFKKSEIKNRRTQGKKGKRNKRWGLRKKRGKSEEIDSDELSDGETAKKRKGRNRKRSKNKKKYLKKRKRSNTEEETDEDEDENVSPSKRKGRKKIRKILDNEKLEEATKHARKLEEERRRRLVERTKNTTFDKPASVNVKEVILEFDSDKKTALVEVDKDLVKHLKPHQVEGVKFMYDCTIESVKSWEKKEEGGGCILAHVMGLGKTLQVVTLVHTLYRSDLIELRRILVVAPLNTVLNWQVEFEKWLSVDDRLDVFVLNEAGSNNWNRADMLKRWHNYGGVLIMGYTMYRNLSQCQRVKSKHQKKIFQETLVDPGPELVICDEGHILRNCKSAISLAMNSIKTKRRIVLTGTPLQNNLLEYHCMVSFVKPNLLGTLREFSNSFIHPIQNGQCADSTPADVRLMKNRCHVLHKMLEGCVQRKDYADIAQFLPPKFEYVIKIRLTEKQREMYKYYLDTFLISDGNLQTRGGALFSDYQALMRIWTHPWCLKLESARQIEKFIDTDDSMADFVVESGEEEESAVSSEEMSWTSNTSEDEKGKTGRRRRVNRSSTSSSEESSEERSDSEDPSPQNANSAPRNEKQSRTSRTSMAIKLDPDQPSTSSTGVADGDISEEEKAGSGDKDAKDRPAEKNEDSFASGKLRSGQEFKEEIIPEEEWYDKFLTDEDEMNVELGSKVVLLLEILADAAALEEKVLVFSHSLISLDVIEKALGGGQIGGNTEDWCRGCDYFRMDGSTSAQMRKRWADIFNDEENKAARLFLISTKAGGLGINLIGASRVIVFDISWNPSHDVQSIFRSYRFGQNKPVFVYRFIAQGTMEEKIYDRQVTKLSVSQRVVDEHQIERHFNANDLAELYRFEPDILENDADERPTPVIPKDPILAELINRLYPKWIVKYHEHDSLLRNRPEEELTEAERKEAWENYEAEKQGLNNRMPSTQNGVNVNFLGPHMSNVINAGIANSTNPTGASFRTPAVSVTGIRTSNPHAQTQHQRVVNVPHQVQQQQQQQRVLDEQRQRLFEFERQRVEIERRREEELRNRETLRQIEMRRQEEIRARQAREREFAEQRRQQLELEQNQQFLQQLLQNRGNQAGLVTQPTGLHGFPPGQSMYRVVVNSNQRPPAPRRSPPRIIELPPDA